MATRVYQQAVTVQSVTINAHDCPDCGVIYGLTDEYEERRREDGQRWFCPNGHGISFADSKAKKLQAELEKAKERLESERGWSKRLSDSLESERRSHSATKGQLTKTRNRIQNGVCPECNRHFTNLEEHMSHEHGSADDRAKVVKRHQRAGS